MNYNHSAKNRSTVTINVTCALVLGIFSFCWLYFFQADVLAVAQHVLSEGVTNYSRTTGAVLITLALQLLQVAVYYLTRLRRRFHALTYFPSMLLLAVISSPGPDISNHFTFGHWYWLVPLLLLIWGAVVWVARALQPYEAKDDTGLFSRCSWINMLVCCFMISGVALAANTNAIYHFRAHAETALTEGDFDEVLRVGNESHETDSSLMMLRMYALSKQGSLGDRLFEYPVVNSSDAILPTAAAGVRLLRYSADSLYKHLGAKPGRPMKPMEYLKAILRSGQAKSEAADYLLCGFLIDKNLDAFVHTVGKFYTVNDSLPKHYREALVLYTHLRSQPFLVYHDPILDVDYSDYQKLKVQYPAPNERKGRIMESYAGSYWYFYDFVNDEVGQR